MKLSSTKVKVFPSAYRERDTSTNKVYNPESRLNTEFNIINILNRAEKDSYVIDLKRVDDSDNTSLPKILICSIHGYYFELDLTDFTYFSSWNDVWAYIILSDKNTTPDSDNTSYPATSLSPIDDQTVNPLDVNGSFVGLELVSTEPSGLTLGEMGYKLHILEKEDGVWNIPSSSLLKFDSKFISNINKVSNKEVNINKRFDTENIYVDNIYNSNVAFLKHTRVGINESNDTSFSIVNEEDELDEKLLFKTDTNKAIIGEDLIFEADRNGNEDNYPLDPLNNDGYDSNKLIFKSYNSNWKTVMGNTHSNGDPLFRILNTNLNELTDTQAGFNLDIGQGEISFNSFTYDSREQIIAPILSMDETSINLHQSAYSCGIYPNSSFTYSLGSKGYDSSDITSSSGRVWDKFNGSNIELWGTGATGANVPYINFHCGGKWGYDYHSRIIAGKDSSGRGALRFQFGKETNSSWSSLGIGFEIYATGSNNSFVCKTSGGMEANWFNATSDKRLKENIKEYKCSKSILDLPIVEFDFKDNKTHHIGCIAQDLQEICPELVHENKDGYLTIEENKLVYLLINEVKELKEEIKSLKKGE